jgi:hypothetical protein
MLKTKRLSNKRTGIIVFNKFEVANITPELLKLGRTDLYKLSKACKRYVNLCKDATQFFLRDRRLSQHTSFVHIT